MTHRDLYTKFMIEYDKANVTSSYPSLTEYEVATFLDKAFKALISQKITGNNVRKIGFEKDLKSIEDLQPLIKSSRIQFSKTADCVAENVVASNLPEDFMYFVGAYVKYNKNTNPVYITDTIYDGTNTFNVEDYTALIYSLNPTHAGGTLQCRSGQQVLSNINVRTYRMGEEHTEYRMTNQVHADALHWGMFEGGYDTYGDSRYFVDNLGTYQQYGFTSGFSFNLASSNFSPLRGMSASYLDDPGDPPVIYINFNNVFPTQESVDRVKCSFYNSGTLIDTFTQTLPIELNPAHFSSSTLLLIEPAGDSASNFENTTLSVYWNASTATPFSRGVYYQAPYFKIKVSLDKEVDMKIFNTESGLQVYSTDSCSGFVVAYPKQSGNSNPKFVTSISSADCSVDTFINLFGEEGYLSTQIKTLSDDYTDANYDFYVFLQPTSLINLPVESDINDYAIYTTEEVIVPGTNTLVTSKYFTLFNIADSLQDVDETISEIKLGPSTNIKFEEIYLDNSEITYDNNDIRTAPVKMLNHELASKFFVSPYNMPWIKTLIGYEENNKLFVVYDPVDFSSYVMNSGTITYIKKPNTFVKDQYDESYECFDYPENASDEVKRLYEFECNETVAEELISLTIIFALENVQSQRLNTKLNTAQLEL